MTDERVPSDPAVLTEQLAIASLRGRWNSMESSARAHPSLNFMR